MKILDFERAVLITKLSRGNTDADSWTAARDRCQDDVRCLRTAYETSIQKLEADLQTRELTVGLAWVLGVALLIAGLIALQRSVRGLAGYYSFSAFVWGAIKTVALVAPILLVVGGGYYIYQQSVALDALHTAAFGPLESAARNMSGGVDDRILQNSFSLIERYNAARKGAGQSTLAILASIVLMWPLIFWVAANADQKRRDAIANLTLRRLQKGKAPGRPVLLYLRSFVLDDAFGSHTLDPLEQLSPRSIVGVVFSVLAWMAVDLIKRRTQLEFFLRHAIQKLPDKPITCSLGRSTGAIGFGRVATTDALWRSQVETLLHNANLVVFMFGNTLGTSWELATVLKSGLLHKVVFIIPPGKDDYALKSDYGNFARQMRDAGFVVPDHLPGSAFVVRSDNTAPVVPLGFGGGQARRFITWLREVYQTAQSA